MNHESIQPTAAPSTEIDGAGGPALVHGHDLLDLLLEAPRTRADLRQTIEARHGQGCRFRTCSAQGFSFDELLGFLEARGKIACEGDMLRAVRENICNH